VNVCNGAANLPGNEEMFVSAADDALESIFADGVLGMEHVGAEGGGTV
jgi:hypothetical protein